MHFLTVSKFVMKSTNDGFSPFKFEIVPSASKRAQQSFSWCIKDFIKMTAVNNVKLLFSFITDKSDSKHNY